MTPASNKLLMHRFAEFVNTANEALAAELISADALFHVAGHHEPLHGAEGYLTIVHMMRGGFPDIQWTLEEAIAEGDSVAARFTIRGTHEGTILGVAPTKNRIEIQAMHFHRFSNGLIVELHGGPDFLGLLQQIGAVPPL